MSRNSSRAHQPHNATPVTSGALSDPSFSKPSASGAEALRSRAPADQIRVRAYEISKTRNGGPRDAASDWSRAEMELGAVHDVKH